MKDEKDLNSTKMDQRGKTQDRQKKKKSCCGRNFPHPSISALGLARPASYTIGTGSLPGSKEAVALSTEVKERVNLYLYFMARYRSTFTYNICRCSNNSLAL
jgi:hypothetical protein